MVNWRTVAQPNVDASVWYYFAIYNMSGRNNMRLKYSTVTVHDTKWTSHVKRRNDSAHIYWLWFLSVCVYPPVRGVMVNCRGISGVITVFRVGFGVGPMYLKRNLWISCERKALSVRIDLFKYSFVLSILRFCQTG